METILTIFVMYVIAVFLYTIIVKNDAMHKFNPHTSIKSIIVDGMKGIGLGFLAVGAIIFVIHQILTWLA